MNRVCVVVCLLLALGLSVQAQETFSPNIDPTITIMRAAGEIKIDGRLDDAGWSGAAHAGNFAEYEPNEKAEPLKKTDVMVTYDDDYLYVAFICEADPEQLRVIRCDYDKLVNDDLAVVCLDTYGSGDWAYYLYTNPLGIQTDFMWSSTAGFVRSFDLVWKSKGIITDSGYQVEYAIPFSSLRFPNTESQTWRVNFHREHPRNVEHLYAWAAYDRDNGCKPCQWGTMKGLESVKPGKGLEITPSFITTQSSSRFVPDDDGPGGVPPDLNTSELVDDDPEADAGILVKYAPTSNLTAEVTYNPDFSQVESDEAQIDVNSTTALFYGERRPFFLEGTDIFRSHFSGFYSRTINDPEIAGKMTWRSGNSTIGVLTAVDQRTSYILPLNQSSALVMGDATKLKSYVNIARLRQSTGRGSYAGMMITDRRLEGGGSGTMAMVDGVARLSQYFRIDWQAMLSYTDEPNDPSIPIAGRPTFDNGDYTTAYDGEKFWGHGGYVSGMFRNRNWLISTDYYWVSPTFRMDNGYLGNNDERQWYGIVSYKTYPNNFFTSITVQADAKVLQDFRGRETERTFGVNSSIWTKGQFEWHPSIRFSRENYVGTEFRDLWLIHNCFTISNAWLWTHWYVNYGDLPAYHDGVVGRELLFGISATLKPIQRLQIEPSINYDRMYDRGNNVELFEGFITRTKLSLQASDKLSARLIVQYNDFSKRWDFEPLLTYRLNAFSVIYAGSGYRYQNYDYDAGPAEYGYGKTYLDERQFFMKLQYQFQM